MTRSIYPQKGETEIAKGRGRCPAIFRKRRYHILVAIKTPLPTPFPIWHLKAAHGER
jgi:hypothetical protein